jgi:hypothetical protein
MKTDVIEGGTISYFLEEIILNLVRLKLCLSEGTFLVGGRWAVSCGERSLIKGGQGAVS